MPARKEPIELTVEALRAELNRKAGRWARTPRGRRALAACRRDLAEIEKARKRRPS